MRKIICISIGVTLIILLASQILPEEKNPFTILELTTTGNQVVLKPSGLLDDPQPDTLLYDGNQPGILLYGGTNLWTEQRFTPLENFQLRSIYILPLNTSNNTTSPCTVAVAANNGGLPGTILTYMIVPAPIPSAYNWIDVNLPTPITFDEGEDFHLMYSSPAGPYPGTGWWPYFDNDGINNNRTKYSSSYSGPSWTAVPFDVMIRAGGEYITTPPGSLSVELTPANPPIIIPETGGSFDFNIAIENISNDPITTDIWTQILLPNGFTTVEPIIVSDNTIPALTSVDRDRNQEIPANAPGGTYTYYAYIGEYPWVIDNYDSFTFEKEGVADDSYKVIPENWLCTGEPFSGESLSEIHHSSFIVHRSSFYKSQPLQPFNSHQFRIA